MDGRFPFSFFFFDDTLAGPILDQAGPSGILLNRSDSPVSEVRESDSPTSSLAQKEKKLRQMAVRRANGSSNEY